MKMTNNYYKRNFIESSPRGGGGDENALDTNQDAPDLWLLEDSMPSLADQNSSTTSTAKRLRASPDTVACVSVDPKKEVATQTSRFRSVRSSYDEWVWRNFGSLPVAFETVLTAKADGKEFKCYRTRHILPNGEELCFVRHSKLHKSLLGWIESCSVASVDLHDNTISPAIFGGVARAALKVFNLPTLHTTKSRENAINELLLQTRLTEAGAASHRVSPLLATFLAQDRAMAVFPMYENGDMFEFLASLEESSDRLSEEEIRAFLKSALTSLKSCHDNGVAHRDVSLENFCLDSHCRPVLIDFGVATQTDASGRVNHTGPVGKAKYMAPELHESIQIQPWVDARKCDVFSLGVVLLILIIQMEPWESTSSRDKKFERLILNGDIEIALRLWGAKGVVSNPLIEVVTKMLSPNPENRPSVDELLTGSNWITMP